MTTQTCNSYTKELTDVIKIVVGIAMSFATINVAVATSSICSVISNEVDVLVVDNLYLNLITTIVLLSVPGIMGLTIFGMTSGMTDIQCSDENAEFGLKLSVYGVVWIAFIDILLILFKVTTFAFGVIANAKLHHLLCTPCFNMMKKIQRKADWDWTFQFHPKIQHTPYHNTSPGGVFRLLWQLHNVVAGTMQPCLHVPCVLWFIGFQRVSYMQNKNSSNPKDIFCKSWRIIHKKYNGHYCNPRQGVRILMLQCLLTLNCINREKTLSIYNKYILLFI